MRTGNHLCPESRKKLSSQTEGTGSDTRAHLNSRGAQVFGGAHSPPAEAQPQRTSKDESIQSPEMQGKARHGRGDRKNSVQLAPTGSRRGQKEGEHVTREVNQGQATEAL